MKPLIEMSIEQYESLLKYASDTSPIFETKNSVKTEANTIAVLCDQDGAAMLRKVANIFAPRLYLKLRRRSEELKFRHSGSEHAAS